MLNIIFHFRYSRQKIPLDDENESSTKISSEKGSNSTDNNNIEGQQNLNQSNASPSLSECSTPEDEKKEEVATRHI